MLEQSTKLVKLVKETKKWLVLGRLPDNLTLCASLWMSGEDLCYWARVGHGIGGDRPGPGVLGFHVYSPADGG